VVDFGCVLDDFLVAEEEHATILIQDFLHYFVSEFNDYLWLLIGERLDVFMWFFAFQPCDDAGLVFPVSVDDYSIWSFGLYVLLCKSVIDWDLMEIILG
jgi:hypothetical protein